MVLSALLILVTIFFVGLKKSYHYLAVAPANGEERTPKYVRITLKHVSFVGLVLDLAASSALALFAINIAFSFDVIWAFLIILIATIFVFAYLPRTKTSSFSKKAAGLCARPFSYFLSRLETPITRFERSLAKANRKLHKPEPITKEALKDLLKEQKSIAGDEMKADLELALTALELNKQKASYAMVRIQKAKIVDSDDLVGPILLSELYDAGRKLFPAQNKDSEIIGSIRIDKLKELKSGGKVSSVMDRQVVKINKNEPVLYVIKKFVSEACELVLVENDEREIIGLVYLEDVLGMLVEDGSTVSAED